MSQSNNYIMEDASVIACELSNQNKHQRRERRPRNGTSVNIPMRESGYIDTLQASYGFITCTDENGKALEKRLFFHHTEYSEKFEELKIGDLVEFYENVKNGRPVAVAVSKTSNKENWCLLPIIQQGEIIGLNKAALNNKKVNKRIGERNDEPVGNITYTVNSEHFFLSFYLSDISDNSQNLKVGDVVNFQISQELWTGALRATGIVKLTKSNRVKGVISSLKEGFGFIEREDEVKEIYFNFAEYPETTESIQLGTELEFTVKHLRNGKEEAINIKILPEGSVVFCNISPDVKMGTVLRAWDIKRQQSDPLSGRISFTDNNSGTCVQLPFGERDQLGSYTLIPGDIVEFQVAQDCRDHLQRATNLRICPQETFANAKEPRQVGMVISLRDRNQGVILADESPFSVLSGDEDKTSNGIGGVESTHVEIGFKMKEFIDTTDPPALYQLVSYTPLKVHRTGVDGKSRETITAIRIQQLPFNSMKNFRNISLLNNGEPVIGVVGQEAAVSSSGESGAGDENQSVIGIIFYQNPAAKSPDVSVPIKKEVISYAAKDIHADSPSIPKKGDTVEFRILELRASQLRMGIEVRVKPTPISPTKKVVVRTPHSKPRSHTIGAISTSASPAAVVKRELAERPRYQGWVIVLKDSFGFIESQDHRGDVYFNFNALRCFERTGGDALHDLTLGCEVDYILRHTKREKGRDMNCRTYAEDVRVLSKGTIVPEKITKSGLCGRILQLARQGNSEYSGEYHGVIEAEESSRPYPYTLMSQKNLRTYFQVNDQVVFDVVSYEAGERAVNVMAIKPPERARVVGLKDNYGFLDYEVTGPVEVGGESSSPTEMSSNSETGGKRQRQVSFNNTSSSPSQLFFHLSAVQLPSDEHLEVGDTVEFVVTQSSKSGRYSAVNIKRIEEGSTSISVKAESNNCMGSIPPAEPRPTRLKIKSVCEEGISKVRLVLIRGARGPDGTGGFKTPRQPWPSTLEA